MKKAIIAISVLLCVSCSLDTTPDFVTPAEAYSTESSVEKALYGVYNALMGQYNRLYTNGIYSYMSISDEFYYISYAASSEMRILAIDASQLEIQRMWEGLYQGISRANYLIGMVEESGLDGEYVAEMVGEAKFLRAYYYYLLVTNWGSVPMPLTPTNSPSTRYFLPQSSINEIYAQIIKDMKDAEATVYDIDEQSSNERISKTGVQAILARVYLSMAGYPLRDVEKNLDVIEYCDKVIDSGKHNLNPDYKQIFINQIQDICESLECIWEVASYGRNLEDKLQAGQLGVENGINCINQEIGYSPGYLRASIYTWQSYDSDSDLRRDWNIAPYRYTQIPGSTDVEKKYWADGKYWERNCGKWRREYENGSKARSYTSTNFPVIRYSDVLLMKAEAINEVKHGPTDEAYELVNMVRRRGYGLPVNVPASCDLPSGLNYSTFTEAIRKERLAELCFEAVRKPDLQRWGIYVESVQKMGNALRVYFPGNTYYRVGENCSERNRLFPIPTSEFSLNKNIVQNNGW